MKKMYLVILVVLVLAAAVLAGCGRQEVKTDPERPKLTGLKAVEPNEDDGAIYSATKEFIDSLVADDREKVLSLLTKDHKNSFDEKAFLITSEAKKSYEEIALENLNYTVVKYVNGEETNFENTGMIFAVYDVVMKNDGQEADRIKIQESLVFRQEDGEWLISLDERGFLVEKQ